MNKRYFDYYLEYIAKMQGQARQHLCAAAQKILDDMDKDKKEKTATKQKKKKQQTKKKASHKVTFSDAPDSEATIDDAGEDQREEKTSPAEIADSPPSQEEEEEEETKEQKARRKRAGKVMKALAADPALPPASSS